MRSHSVPATRQWWESRLYPQPKQILDLATPEGCKVELTYVTRKRTGWDLSQRPVNRKSNALPQRQHATQQRHIATEVARSVVWVFVCVLGTRVSCAKQLNRSRCRSWWLTYVGPRNHVDGSQDRTQPREVTGRRCDLLPNYFGNLFLIYFHSLSFLVWLKAV